MNYTSLAEEALIKMKDAAEKEGVFEEIKMEYEKTLEKVSPNQAVDLEKKRQEIVELLENETLENFQLDEKKLSNLVKKNVAIKTAVVVQDEFEQGDRRLLNFGHTIGHAIENNYQLLHGHAISIGMMAACSLSVTLNEFSVLDRDRVARLIEKYQLPIHQKTDWKKIWEILKMDKKRAGKEMNFVLLNKIGEAVVYPIPMGQLQDLINQSL